MFSPTIMLLIGGFTISSALSKTNIDRVLITRVLSLAGTRPSTVLLTFMGVSCFASMWIRSVPSSSVSLLSSRCIGISFVEKLTRNYSNVAAPTLCFTLIRVCFLLYTSARPRYVSGTEAVNFFYCVLMIILIPFSPFSARCHLGHPSRRVLS